MTNLSEQIDRQSVIGQYTPPLLSSEQTRSFHDNGFLVLPPGFLLTDSEVNSIVNVAHTCLPTWTSGFIDSKTNNSREDPRFGPYYKTSTNVGVSGIAREHICTRGAGSIDKDKDTNWLYGKRATANAHDWDHRLVHFVEHEKVLALAREMLGATDLSFHTGAITATYPGYVGEPHAVHADTLGFVADRKIAHNCSLNNRFVLNFLMYLSDVTLQLSPTKVVPKSHSQYSTINSHLAKCFKQPDDGQTFYFQSGLIYEDLITDVAEKPVLVTGKKGTLICMQSTTLHAATANTSPESMRHIIVFNYTNRDHVEFRKDFSGAANACRNFVKLFKDPKLVERTFGTSARRINLPKLKGKLKGEVLNRIQAGKRQALFVYGTGKNYFTQEKHLPTDRKPYLNLGASPGWRHPTVVCLDYDPIKSEVACDLNSSKPLPFVNERFSGVYSSHCIEHLKESAVDHILQEVYRILKPGAVFRITLPDITKFLHAYDERDVSFFHWAHGKGHFRYNTWLRLIVRLFAEPVVDRYTDEELQELYITKTHEEFLNFFTEQVNSLTDERYLFPAAHKSWHSVDKLTNRLLKCGFAKVRPVGRFESDCLVFTDRKIFNNTRPHLSLYIEATK